MKKGLFILFTLCFSGLMMAQEVQEIKGAHPYKLEENENGIAQEISHWSLIPHVGFNAFDGDFTSEMKHNVAVPALGLALEYNFTPVWNIGIEYMYDMYNVTGKQNVPANNADTLLFGHQHKAGAYVSLDLINLFFPRAQRKIFSLFPYVGAGGAWYKRSAYYMDDKYWGFDANGQVVQYNPTHGRGNTAGYINAEGKNAPEHDTQYHMVGYLQAGLNAEFNLNRTLALGIRANYTYFTRDYVDGRGYFANDESAASKNNDGIFDITLNLRFKLAAVSKSHVRNIVGYDAFDKNEPILVHDTTIIIRHDSVIIRETEKETAKQPGRIFNVYFANDDAKLDETAHTTINEVASTMEDDEELYAVVIGYCDNTGSKAHNYELGDKRSANVTEELLQEYDIPADHVFKAGMGKIAARKSDKAFGPNRRVSIHLVDKETFELMKLQLTDDSEERNVDESQPVTFENSKAVRVPKLSEDVDLTTVPLSESARKEGINQYKQRNGETVTIEKGMSLAKLARKYYDNSTCWVYIYCANTDQLASPNDLKEGMQILVPELTEEELNVTKQQCLALYNYAVHQRKANK